MALKVTLVVFPALAVGLAVMLGFGATTFAALNLGAAILGFIVVGVAGRSLANGVGGSALSVAAAVLALESLTFLNSGIDGVHRWVSIGPVHLHLGAIVDPILLLALTRPSQRAAMLLAAVGFALHAAQPDAAQATALAAGLLAAVLGQGAKPSLAVVAGFGAALAWWRPDPLAPVDLVENMVPKAFAFHPVAGVLGVVALALIPAVAFARGRRFVGVGAYLAGQMLAGVFGHFPTPVLGFGASHVLGTMVALGVASGLSASPAKPLKRGAGSQSPP